MKFSAKQKVTCGYQASFESSHWETPYYNFPLPPQQLTLASWYVANWSKSSRSASLASKLKRLNIAALQRRLAMQLPLLNGELQSKWKKSNKKLGNKHITGVLLSSVQDFFPPLMLLEYNHMILLPLSMSKANTYQQLWQFKQANQKRFSRWNSSELGCYLVLRTLKTKTFAVIVANRKE